ncbi:MAG: hypothetical protein ACPL1A_08675 [Candidatus Kapaibacteriota bacterium]
MSEENILNNKEPSKFNRFSKNRIQPRGYYAELAEMDALLAYVNEYMGERFNNDEDFKDEIFKIIYENSKHIQPQLEVFLLERLIHSLSYFNEMMSEWINQNQ